MACLGIYDTCMHTCLFRFSFETSTNRVLSYDLLAILEKQDAEQLQAFKAKSDKAVLAENKAVHETEVKSPDAERARLGEKAK